MESFDWICPPCCSTTLPLSNICYNIDHGRHVNMDRKNCNAHKRVNLPDFDWINQLPLSLDQLYVNSFEIFNDAFLTQVNPYATRNSNILDLVLTTVPDLVHSVSISEGLLDSDHRSFTFFLNINNTSFHKRPKYVLNLKKANLKELKKTLQSPPWATAMLDNDVKNMNLINWEDLFWTAVNEFVSQKRINDKFTPSWIDKEVKVLCRRKDRASSKALRTKDSRDLNHFKSLRRGCKSLIRSKYNNAYLRQLADNIPDNPKKFWSCYSVKTETRKLPLAIKKDVNSNSLVTDTLEKANQSVQ